MLAVEIAHIANIGMLVGGLVWLCSELLGAWNNRKKDPWPIDTTSQWAWLLEAKWPLTRVIFGTFLLLLFSHIVFHTNLFPGL